MTGDALGSGALRPGLVVGVSAMGYRCEGGFNGPGQPANQWGAWERVGAPGTPSPGVDLWRHPEPAIERAAAAGAQVLALGVEWARVEPAPGQVDDAALARYAQILELSRRHGLLPVVALYDIAHPQWLGEELWLTPGAPDRFAEHAARVVTRLADHCRHWLTMRQPNHVAHCGWVAGAHPPRRLGALSDAWAVVDNLASAHVLAYDQIHRVQRDAVVAWGRRRAASYDEGQLMVDLVCAPHLGVERDALDAWVDERRARHDAAFPPANLAMLAWRRAVGRTSPFGRGSRPARRPSPRRIIDVGFQRTDASLPLDALWLVWRPSTAPGPARGAEDAGALVSWCTSAETMVPRVPVWIEDGVPLSPGTQGGDARTSYLRASIRAVAEARAGGAPVAGYVHHALGPDTEAALSPPPWAPRFLAPAAGDYGIFAVTAGPDGDPVWREHDANGERASAVLADLARRNRRAGE